MNKTTVITAALVLVVVTGEAASRALAQTATVCGPDTPDKACELTGYNILANPNKPGLLVLQLKTAQGPYSFIATRDAIEKLGKALVREAEEPNKQKE